MDDKKTFPLEENKKSSDSKRYPRSIIFIIGNEFCERFSYYGMKAILVLYFKNVLQYSDNSATKYFHLFAMSCYFTPIFGAIIADAFLGKFKTIFYISILYAIGNVVLSFGSLSESRAISWLGLSAIALGTGGIKPCVSAFGGDQFGPGQEKHLQTFFSYFYIAINSGSLLSTFITPILREDVRCFDRDDCFPLAFGVPALLMILALVLFFIGKFLTNYVMIPPSKQNIVLQLIVCIYTALSRKAFKSIPKKDHWLDYADDKYDAQTLTDMKAALRILTLYLPLPIFWALFDQQGSRWTLQATRMDGNFFGIYRLKPDQIQVVNPLLIISMIPVFDYVVYPFLAKMNLFKKPLQRITTGGFLAALAFFICALFQLKIEEDLPTELLSGSAHLTVINGLSIDITFTDLVDANRQQRKLEKYSLYTFENVNIENWKIDSTMKIKLEQKVGDCDAKEYIPHFNGTFKDGAIILITESMCNENSTTIQKYDFPNILKKPRTGGAYVGIVFNIHNYDYAKGNGSFWFKNEEFSEIVKPSNISYRSTGITSFASTGLMAYNELNVHKGGQYELNYLRTDSDKSGPNTPIAKNLALKQGGTYLMVVYGDSDTKLDYKLHQIVIHNSLSMFWLIIQYFIITIGEIMFSITGLDFTYTQAPKSMKSVFQAAWLMTIAFGNLIDAIVATISFFPKQSYEFFFFAALMALDMIVFAFMANSYIPLKEEDKSEKLLLDENKIEELDN